MKKTKIISLLVFAPLLVGCGSKIEKPKFAKYGDEVKGDKFFKDFIKKHEAASFSKKAKFEGLVYKGLMSEFEMSETKRNNKVIESSAAIESMKFDMQIDIDHAILYQATSMGMDSEKVKGSIKEALSGEEKLVTQQQVSSIKGEKYIVELDVLNKVYERGEKAPKTSEIQTSLDTMAKNYSGDSLVEALQIVYMSYETASDKEKKNYKFYENKEVFTAEVSLEKTQKDKTYKATYTTTQIAQVDMSEGKWSSKVYWEQAATFEYLKDCYDEDYNFRKKGDVVVGKAGMTQDITATRKSLNLKVIDLSDYAEEK